MDSVNAASPWLTHARKINCLFEKDPDINVVYDGSEEPKVSIYVNNQVKADAIMALMPNEKQFGNVILKIEVIPANQEELSPARLIDLAFTGNAAYMGMETIDSMGFEANYAIFEDEVVQYPNDNLGSLWGVNTTLYEDLARDIFDGDKFNGVFFNTYCDGENLGAPIGRKF